MKYNDLKVKEKQQADELEQFYRYQGRKQTLEIEIEVLKLTG